MNDLYSRKIVTWTPLLVTSINTIAFSKIKRVIKRLCAHYADISSKNNATG